jgi:hypothetical protein
LTIFANALRRLWRLKIFFGVKRSFLRLSAKKDLFTPQNFFGGEAAVYSCKNCQRTIFIKSRFIKAVWF